MVMGPHHEGRNPPPWGTPPPPKEYRWMTGTWQYLKNESSSWINSPCTKVFTFKIPSFWSLNEANLVSVRWGLAPLVVGSLKYFTANINIWALFDPTKAWKFTPSHFKPKFDWKKNLFSAERSLSFHLYTQGLRRKSSVHDVTKVATNINTIFANLMQVKNSQHNTISSSHHHNVSKSWTIHSFSI